MSANGPHKDAASQSARSTAELAAYRQRQREIQLAYENQQSGSQAKVPDTMRHSLPLGAQRSGQDAIKVEAQTAAHGQGPAQLQHVGYMRTYPGINVATHGCSYPGTGPAHHAATQADLNVSGELARPGEAEAPPYTLTQFVGQSPFHDPHYPTDSLFLVEETVDNATTEPVADVSATGETGHGDLPTSESDGTVFETDATYGGSGSSTY